MPPPPLPGVAWILKSDTLETWAGVVLMARKAVCNQLGDGCQMTHRQAGGHEVQGCTNLTAQLILPAHPFS